MKFLAHALAGLAAAVLFAAPASADELSALAPDLFDALAPMTDLELSEERGGLKTPLGEIDFGAVVRTFVDGQIVLETELDWTDAGAVQNRVLGVLQNELNQQSASLNGEGASVIIGDASGGATTVLHEITNEQIANVVINTANNRDIRLETDITLVIPDLSQLQEDLAGQQLEMGLQDAIGMALINAGL